MKNKRGNVAVIAIIVVIVAITAGVIGWMFAKKSQTPIPQTVSTQSSSVAQIQTPVNSNTQSQQKVTVPEPQQSYKTTAQIEASIAQNTKNIKIDKKFTPSWFNDDNNELLGKSDGGGYPVYTNERLCFQITLPSYLKENYNTVVRSINLIGFNANVEEKDKAIRNPLFSIGRMSNAEYVYYTTIESRGGFADSQVIGNTDKYVYLLQDTTGPIGDKTDFATAENLKFRIIDCK